MDEAGGSDNALGPPPPGRPLAFEEPPDTNGLAFALVPIKTDTTSIRVDRRGIAGGSVVSLQGKAGTKRKIIVQPDQAVLRLKSVGELDELFRRVTSQVMDRNIATARVSRDCDRGFYGVRSQCKANINPVQDKPHQRVRMLGREKWKGLPGKNIEIVGVS